MFKSFQHLIVCSCALFGFMLSQPIHADQLHIEADDTARTFTQHSTNRGGFVFDIKPVNYAKLAEDVETLQNSLVQRQHELIKQVDKKKLNAGDALITVVMPGGLLYAGYRKHELEKAKKLLQAVNVEIKEFANDLLALRQQRNHDLQLAQLP